MFSNKLHDDAKSAERKRILHFCGASSCRRDIEKCPVNISTGDTVNVASRQMICGMDKEERGAALENMMNVFFSLDFDR